MGCNTSKGAEAQSSGTDSNKPENTTNATDTDTPAAQNTESRSKDTADENYISIVDEVEKESRNEQLAESGEQVAESGEQVAESGEQLAESGDKNTKTNGETTIENIEDINSNNGHCVKEGNSTSTTTVIELHKGWNDSGETEETSLVNDDKYSRSRDESSDNRNDTHTPPKESTDSQSAEAAAEQEAAPAETSGGGGEPAAEAE